MTKIEAYRYLDREGLGWIANVFLTGGGSNGARTLKALATLHQKGHEFASISFTMPYEQMYMDGKNMTPEQIRQAAKGVK